VKLVKIIGILVVLYVGLVTAFESLLGSLQPSGGRTMVITTFDDAGTPRDRVVSRLESGGQTYVAANHWPRAWYRRALERPDVEATIDGAKGAYRAVPVTGDEEVRVNGDNRLGFVFRILTGFPPRYFLRLDPRQAS